MPKVHAALFLAVVVLVGGCGGSGQEGTPSPDTTAFKINEYVGDGHNGTRPLPDLFQSSGVTTQRLADLLGLNTVQLAQIVPQLHSNWFRLAPVSISARLMVTVQPTNDGDPDLFVTRGIPFNNGNFIASSNRTSGMSPDGVAGANHFVPDWAAFDVTNTGGLPTAQVAVFGFSNGTSPNSAFRVEADRVFDVTVNAPGWAGTLPQNSSHWVKFAGVSGTQYTVHLVDNGGDPDVYVYGATSTTFKGKNTTAGSGDFAVSFTASDTQDHYVRIYGFEATNQYQLLVLSP